LQKLKSADSKKVPKDSRYGGLEGQKSRPNDHRSSSRYISDPTGKTGQEMAKSSDKTKSSDKKKASLIEPDDLEQNLPVTEDDYLLPQTSAHLPAYMDIVPDPNNGIFPNIISFICLAIFVLFRPPRKSLSLRLNFGRCTPEFCTG